MLRRRRWVLPIGWIPNTGLQGCKIVPMTSPFPHHALNNCEGSEFHQSDSAPRVVGLQGHSNYTNISHHAVGGCHGGDEGFQSGREPRHRQTWLRLFPTTSTFPIMHCWSQSSQCRKSASFVGYWATLGPPSETDKKRADLFSAVMIGWVGLLIFFSNVKLVSLACDPAQQ